MATPLRRLQPEIQMVIEKITPELAKEYLAANTHNRPLKRNKIAEYVRDLKAGNWRFTGEGIKFSVTHVLLDGQNRLHAIVESGVPMTVPVWRDLPDDTQEVMDTGTKRSVADALGLRNESNAKHLATLASIVMYDGSDNKAGGRVTTAEVIDLVEIDPSLRYIATEVMPRYRINNLTPSVVGYCYWRFNAIDPADAKTFFDRLHTLSNLDPDDPVLALNRRLVNGFDQRRSRDYRREAIACVFLAWNAWRKGEARRIIKIARSSDGRLAMPEPR